LAKAMLRDKIGVVVIGYTPKKVFCCYLPKYNKV
jgi:hypothetical protein